MKELPPKQQRKIETPDVAATVAAIYGCKWSLRILGLIQDGICRPGAIERSLPGLTTRVQSYYFSRMMELGIINKNSYPEVPPRVEYSLTDYGKRVLIILESIKSLQKEIEAEIRNTNTEQGAAPN